MHRGAASLFEAVAGAPASRGGRVVALAGLASALSLLATVVFLASRRTLTFDDAYMFYRYAWNIRHGLGVAWNPDGLATYGLTSQLWVFCVLPFTLLPISPAAALRLASWLAGIAALAPMTLAVMRHARFAPLRRAPVAFALAGAPLLVCQAFETQMITGMDTMLSLLANAALVLAILGYAARPRMAMALAVGALGFLAVLARPENALGALGVPALVWAGLPAPRRWADLLGLLVLPALSVGADLAFCQAYFGTALPLSFYAKAMHAYAGFQNPENALGYLFAASTCALPFLAIAAATVTRAQIPRLLAFALPVAATFAYLLTMRQIMGHNGRYYIPFLPFLVVPALLAADAALAANAGGAVRRMAVAVVTAAAVYLVSLPLQHVAAGAFLRLTLPPPIPAPMLVTASGRLPPDADWFSTLKALGDRVAAGLPPGASIAASEVGYLGAVAPTVTVIDLVGLNDTRISRHGFSMDDFLARAPDFVWLPHADYTGLRARMFGDPRLFERYDVYAGAFGYGVAVKRGGPREALVRAGLAKAWADLYPGRSLEAYRVVARQPPAA